MTGQITPSERECISQSHNSRVADGVSATATENMQIPQTSELEPSLAKTPWVITRIARCGGLSKLNREQRRYARAALATMLEHGGMVWEHRCHANARLLALTDLLYGQGRIVGWSGTVNGGDGHGWCEVDEVPIEISYPFVLLSEREARIFTLEQMCDYEETNVYDYTRRSFPQCVCDFLDLMDSRNANLSPANAEIMFRDLAHKLAWSIPDSFGKDLAQLGEDASLELSKVMEAGRNPGEDLPQFHSRIYKTCNRFLANRLKKLLRVNEHGSKVQQICSEMSDVGLGGQLNLYDQLLAKFIASVYLDDDAAPALTSEKGNEQLCKLHLPFTARRAQFTRESQLTRSSSRNL